MDGIAIKAMVSELAPVVREYVAAAQSPLLERITALESEKGALAIRCDALEEAQAGVVAIDLGDVQKLIDVEIAKLPPPESAKEVNKDELAAMVNDAVLALPPAQDGTSVGIADVLPIIAAEVEKAIAAVPAPKDGENGQDGKDAAGIVEALKDSGELVLTLQDGRLLRTGIRDGEKGADGKDGFGFDDMDVAVLDDDRTIEIAFRQGDDEKAFTLKWPTVIDRGVYKAGEDYSAGDGVTWGGSFWIAQKDTGEKPDTPDSGWRLAVKKGRDGKDARKDG